MSHTSKLSLLEELRAQAAAVREDDAAARLPVERAREEINGCLWRAFRWLDEAMGHLEVIRPTAAHKFQLDTLLTIDSPRFDGGFASFRRRGLSNQDDLDHVQVFYRVSGPEPLLLRVHPSAALSSEQRLRGSSLRYRYETQQDERGQIRFGVFRVEPTIAASILFQPDYERRIVQVTLSNVDRFETVRLDFKPSAIDVPALEDLLRFMLGEPNGFLHRAPLALMKNRRDDSAEAPAAPGDRASGSHSP